MKDEMRKEAEYRIVSEIRDIESGNYIDLCCKEDRVSGMIYLASCLGLLNERNSNRLTDKLYKASDRRRV